MLSVLWSAPVISAQLIRGYVVSGRCLRVTTYYAAALAMLLIDATVPARFPSSWLKLLPFLDLTELFGEIPGTKDICTVKHFVYWKLYVS